MPNETLGASFNIDITQLKAGLTQANRLIKESNSEFKALAAGLDDYNDAQKIAEGRIKNLSSVVELQGKKVDALQKEYDRLLAEGLDPASAQMVKLRTDINNEKAALEKNKKELEKQTKALEEMTAETNDTRTASQKLRDEIGKQEQDLEDLKEQYTNVVLEQGKGSKEAKELQSKIKELNSALGNNKSKLKDAEGATEDYDDATEEARDGTSRLDIAVGNLAANIVSSLVSAIGSAISSFGNLAEETQEYREDIGKLETAWESAGKSTELATETYKNFYSVLGEEDRSVEAVNHLAKFVDTEKDMATWTDICTGVWGTFGDSLPIEGLTEAANETAKTGQLTGVLADALNWAGVNEDAFQESLDKCNDESERASKITDTLNGLYKDAADRYRENNKSVIEARKATSDYTDTLADLGEEIEPVKMELTELKTEALKELAPVIKKDVVPAIKQMIKQLKDSGTIQKFGKAVSNVVKDVLPPLVNILTFCIDHFKELAIGIGLAVGAWKTMQVVTTVTTALKGATTAMGALNAVMAANPIGAVVTAVGGLVTAFSLLFDSIGNAKNEFDYMSEAIEKNTEANNKWQETMDNARAELGDYSDFANAAGDTTETLTERMNTAQNNITQIYSNAFNENRTLRQSEIDAIRRFNQEYVEAQNELVLLEQQILQAQSDTLQWRLENMRLSEEEEQGILNTLSQIRSDYNETLSEAISAELVLLEQRFSNNQISEEEYNKLKEEALAKQAEYAEKEKEITQQVIDSALEAQRNRAEINLADYNNRVHTYQSIEEITEAYHAKQKQIDEDENLSGWDKYWAKQALLREFQQQQLDFYHGEEVTWTDYNFLIDQKIQENQRIFFNWISNMKENGKSLSDENKKTAKAIVDAYSDLPEDLQEAGLNSLRGLAEGMADEFPELEKAAEMDMNELIDSMNTALGNASPSKKMRQAGRYVMEGLGNGMNSKLPDIRGVVTSIGKGLINGFKSLFDINSPSGVAEGWGKNIVDGLVNGISDNTGEAVIAVKKQCKAIEDAYDFNDITNSITAGATVRTRESNGTIFSNGNMGGVVVYQTNNYSQAHSRYELFKSQQATRAAVKAAIQK